MERTLNELGFNDITQAEDGQDAWVLIQTCLKQDNGARFDLVISDLEMPRMSGLELLELIRTTQGLKQTPFIMATTITAKEIILQTMRLGVQAYIVKPFDRSTVAFKLKQAGII
jgi:two-component system chemotaxis response regulator CheY